MKSQTARILLSLIPMALLIGCSTTNSGFRKPDLSKVNIGMTKPEVIAALGKPDGTASQGATEYLEYGWDSPWDGVIGVAEWYYVRLIDGGVESFGRKGDFESSGARTTATRQTAALSPSTDLVMALEGAVIVAHDGQPLGTITQNEVAANSILNEVGRYGSEVSSVSIFNPVGRYGSEVSSLSPFNEFATTPPRIIAPSGQFLGYLTKNTFKSPAVDPHLLIGLLKSRR
jgi:hypothetical protein